MVNNMEKLDAELIMELRVSCPNRLEVGENQFGYLRAILIDGGEFRGKLNGRIVPGGADWNMGYGGDSPESVKAAHVFAKYLLQTDDGVYIAVENQGYRDKTLESQPYIVTTPTFHAPKGRYEWLNYGVFVGSLSGSVKDGIQGVDIKIYQML